MRMTRKVLIHSRVFGSQQDRSMELPPGGSTRSRSSTVH